MVKTHKASANISTERGAINIARFFIASNSVGKSVVSKVIVGAYIASKDIISNAIATKPKIAFFFLFDFFILDCYANLLRPFARNEKKILSYLRL